MSQFTFLKTAAAFGVALGATLSVSAAETPYDLIRPVYPMTWDTLSAAEGGTVYDFANFKVNEEDTFVGTPKSGSKPADFKANAYIADTVDQAYLDALILQPSDIRVNQAGYLTDDPEKQFYYVSDKCEEATYSVVDLDGEEVAKGGKFKANGTSDQVIRVVNAFVNSLLKRYTVEKTTPGTKVCAGKLAELAALPTDKRLRIKVGKQYSSTFIVSDKVYSMVRDANLKFFGVQRSGDSESWFHGPSHVHDTITGGWYDAGDFLKEAPTMGYAFMMLSVLSTVHPERDEDHYAFNHNEIVKTDGIPDMLREARHGAEFYLRSYEYAKGEIKDMIVNIGDETDHIYWTRADSMESIDPVPPRPVIHGIGPGMSAQVAAGLALLSVSYATYDKPFADSCLKVAEKLYAYAKEHFGEEEVCYQAFYSCSNPSKYVDVLAMAAIALHYATYEKSKKMDYLNDAAEDKKISDNSQNHKYESGFAGGWLGKPSGFSSAGWTSTYDERYAITSYAFYKLLLADKETAAKYGIQDSLRIDYTSRLKDALAKNVYNDAGSDGDNSVTIHFGPVDHRQVENFYYATPWYVKPFFNYVPVRYESGLILNMLAYAEVAKSDEIRQLAINKMNYILGANQWDMSFMVGVGDKNDAHAHNRTANPEGWNRFDKENMAERPVGYSYRPPVGALLGGSMSDTLLSDWNKYGSIETAIDINATFLAANVLLSPAATAADTSKKDTTKKDAIVNVPEIGVAGLEIVNRGMTLDVNYTLPTEQNVKITLVSVKGKVQRQYAPGRQTAGSHALQWNVEAIPAGAYIVNYTAGSFHQHKLVKITR